MDSGLEAMEVKSDQKIAESGIEEDSYLAQLMAENSRLDPSLTHCSQLLAKEIARVQAGQDEKKFIELHHDKPTKMSVKVRVPVKEFPKFNFVGKILGPKGNSLKRIQEETGTRMAVFGRGSMRDKNKEEELRQEGGKYTHLNEDLHVNIEVYAHPVECYYRLSQALFELRRHLVPDYNDEVTQSQVQELAYLNGKASSPIARGGGFCGRGGGGAAGMRDPVSPPDFGRGNILRDPVSRSANMGGPAYGGSFSLGRGGMVRPPQGSSTSLRPGSAGSLPSSSYSRLRQF